MLSGFDKIPERASGTWRTDGQIDGRTGRIAISIPRSPCDSWASSVISYNISRVWQMILSWTLCNAFSSVCLSVCLSVRLWTVSKQLEWARFTVSRLHLTYDSCLPNFIFCDFSLSSTQQTDGRTNRRVMRPRMGPRRLIIIIHLRLAHVLDLPSTMPHLLARWRIDTKPSCSVVSLVVDRAGPIEYFTVPNFLSISRVLEQYQKSIMKLREHIG